MDRVDQTAATYDEMFAEGGHEGVYDLPYHRSPYYPMYKAVLKELRKLNASSVLEVGCGTGAFASFLLHKQKFEYSGFDFSEVAVEKAQVRTGRSDLFYVADATQKTSYHSKTDAIVCTEVLEHLEDDIGVVSNWPRLTNAVCTVPNYDSSYHERYFRNESEVVDRYSSYLDIKKIYRVKKPALNDLKLSNRMRELRWQRYKPKRLLQLLGLGDFDEVGGWFVFVGTTKSL